MSKLSNKDVANLLNNIYFNENIIISENQMEQLDAVFNAIVSELPEVLEWKKEAEKIIKINNDLNKKSKALKNKIQEARDRLYPEKFSSNRSFLLNKNQVGCLRGQIK